MIIKRYIISHKSLLIKMLLLGAFAIPLLWLYFIDAVSFEMMWKGRTFQLFFIWLVGLELILSWEALQEISTLKLFSTRSVMFAASLVLPTLYVVASNFWNLNNVITNWAVAANIEWANAMPLSIEYLVFAVLFSLITSLAFGFKGLKLFFVPMFFLVLVGTVYIIDNVYPYGQFTPFQIFVPTTTMLAASILGALGYATTITYEQSSLQGNMPVLTASDLATGASSTFKIAWPCAGIESFLIFTVITLLFLKRMTLSWKAKIGYFVFGVIITYIINSLRVVNIFLIDINGGNIDMFHFYYGPLFAVAWIVSYPLIIIASQSLWRRIRERKNPFSKKTLQA